MITKRVVNVLFLAVFTLEVNGQLEATEWCPPGTWWTYKNQKGVDYRWREHEIYIYRKDTQVQKRTVKKIDVYKVDSDMVLYAANIPFDSFTNEPRYLGYVLMYRSNDSIYGLYNFRTFVDFYVQKPEFVFLYKFNSKVGDIILYDKQVYDTFFCNTKSNFLHPGIRISSGSYTLSTEILNYSLDGKQIKLSVSNTIRTTPFSMYGHKKIYNNLGPSEYMICSPFLSDFRDTIRKITDSLAKYHNCSSYGGALGQYCYEFYDMQLWCYYQGGQGMFIDRHFGGYGSGCNYVYDKVIKNLSSISSPKRALNISIRPNPTSDYIYFDGLSADTYYVRVYTIDGRLKANSMLNSGINRIDLKELGAATYLLHVYNKDLKLLHFEKMQLKSNY
jgi:hypothetical protein